MTDLNSADESRTSYRMNIEHFDKLDPEFAEALLGILNGTGLAETLASGVALHVPDADTWRLTISGDVQATVDTIEQRDVSNAYTLERGVGSVGARTMKADDGTYDIVIGALSLMPDFDVSSVEELVNYMHGIGSHLAIHESGHVILHQRGEDADAFQDLATGTDTELVWKKHLAAHMDDFRIEKMTNRTAPAPFSHVPGISETIAHMRNELTESNVLRYTDGETATMRSSTAVNSLVRVMTYLTAELGGGRAIVVGTRPDPIPAGWAEYLESVWDAWILNLDRLKPADDSMGAADLAEVLSDLCKLIVIWMQDVVGYQLEIHADGSYTAMWSKAIY